MAKFSIEVKRKDFLWIVPVLVLVSVGFVYSYGGSEPSVMGHSAEELEVSPGVNIKQYIDEADNLLYQEINDIVIVQGGATNMLVYDDHDTTECVNDGGTVMYVEDSDGRFCQFSGSSCSAVGDGSWSQFKSWKGYASSAWEWACDNAPVGTPDSSACGLVERIPGEYGYMERQCVGAGMANVAVRKCTQSCGALYTVTCSVNKVGCY